MVLLLNSKFSCVRTVGDSFKLSPMSLGHDHMVFHSFLPSSLTICSRLILYIFSFKPRLSPCFFKDIGHMYFIRWKYSLDGRTQHTATWIDESRTFCYLWLQTREEEKPAMQGRTEGCTRDRVTASWSCRKWIMYEKPSGFWRLANLINYMGSWA